MCAARLGAVNAVHLGRHSQWGEEACPACDEAECIAAKCIEWAEGCYQRGEDDAVRELNEMADFARGDR
jgi:hypothetical protein